MGDRPSYPIWHALPVRTGLHLWADEFRLSYMQRFGFFAGNLSWDKEEFFQKARTFFDFLLEQLPTFWHYPLFHVDKNPITIGNIILGIVFVVGGYMSIRIFVSQFDKRILSRFDIDIPHRYTIRLFLSYFLIFILFLFTLYFVKVPLTVFTVLGGALALGIGFGARNIMNNLICGIVIVTEHPIRVGDLIEVNNLIGIVENIGFRATSIRSLDNTHILVPNSIILEHSILNWTLSDKVIRSKIKVGVSYDSPVEKVRDLLLQSAQNHKSVLTYNKQQSPIVFFDDFGDSGLIFELNYWIAIDRPIDIKIVASELRFEIKKLFQQEGIVIPYPQQDLHVKEPVRVEIGKN